jgi:excinuclease UvrABC nuclease subunit
MRKLLVQTKKLPDTPGVYFFTRGREILYIGKATSLRDRVRSYFSFTGVEASRGGRIMQMLALATGIRYQQTDSVLEALLLESALIKKHQPKYNAREKDDKSYWFVVITDEEFPRVLMVRGKDLLQEEENSDRFTHLLMGSLPRRQAGDTTQNFPLLSAYGPFPNSSELREALRLIRKILPFRDKCKPLAGEKCFNAQIGLCPGVCDNSITRVAYNRRIGHLQLLLAGRVRPLIAKLTHEMKVASRRQDFEKSAQLRDQIRALKHIQDVGLIKTWKSDFQVGGSPTSRFRIEAYDIAYLGGSNAVGVMVVMEDGELKPSDHRKFKVKNGGDDLANLREVLERRLAHHEWPRPDLIVVDGGVNQLNTAKNILAKTKIAIPVVSVVKDERHKPKEILSDQKLLPDQRRLILLLNHEAHRFAITFHRHRRKIV